MNTSPSIFKRGARITPKQPVELAEKLFPATTLTPIQEKARALALRYPGKPWARRYLRAGRISGAARAG